MKKIALLLVFTIFGITQASAQNFGFKGGYNYSSLNGEVANDSSLKGRSGFYVGALLELPLGDVISLQPELVYSRQGASWEYKTLGTTTTKDLKMDYLNIPVMAKVNLGPLFLQGGVQFGFLVGKPEVSYTVGNLSNSQKLDKGAYAAFDFGVGAGLGINFNSHFFAEARYTHSLTNSFDNSNTSLRNARISDTNNFKNAVLSLGVGVKF